MASSTTARFETLQELPSSRDLQLLRHAPKSLRDTADVNVVHRRWRLAQMVTDATGNRGTFGP
jgi:hypothetical protein